MTVIITGSPTRYDKRILQYLQENYPLEGRSITVNFLAEPGFVANVTCDRTTKKSKKSPDKKECRVVGLFSGRHTNPEFTITIASNERTFHKAATLFHEFGHAFQCHNNIPAWAKYDSPALEKDADEFAYRLRKEATAAGLKYISYKDRMKGWTF